jgi:hypothetical protein
MPRDFGTPLDGIKRVAGLPVASSKKWRIRQTAPIKAAAADETTENTRRFCLNVEGDLL